MGFLNAVVGEVKGKIPGLSLITGIAKDPIGAIFGRHSEYNFNPYHPPGAWRGKAARQTWERKRAALGFGAYTNAEGVAFKAYQKGGGSVSGYRGYLDSMSPGVLQKTSPIMPGGADLEGRVARIYSHRHRRDPESGRHISRARFLAIASGRGGRKRRKGAASRRTSRLKFGSPAWRRKFMNKRRKRR